MCHCNDISNRRLISGFPLHTLVITSLYLQGEFCSDFALCWAFEDSVAKAHLSQLQRKVPAPLVPARDQELSVAQDPSKSHLGCRAGGQDTLLKKSAATEGKWAPLQYPVASVIVWVSLLVHCIPEMGGESSKGQALPSSRLVLKG